jgi:hypothetical protein
MPRKHLKSNAEVAAIIESEGLGYAIQCYMSADSIEDKVLATYWEEAKEVLDKIEEYLEEFSDEAQSWEELEDENSNDEDEEY